MGESDLLKRVNTSHSTLLEFSAGNEQLSSVSLADEVIFICQWLFYSVVCQAIDVFGIITNIINIICFVRQGFKDPVNVSLFGLAIADIGSLSTLLWTNLCINPTFNALDLPFEPTEVQFLTGGMTHCTFTRVTAWITVLITLERCLCITAPLKVKHIVTPKRVTIIIVCVFAILISSIAPFYVVTRLGLKFSPMRNKTVLGLVFIEGSENVERVSYAINNIFIPFTAFFIIIACTIILVVKLRTKTKWRKTNSVTEQADRVSARNQKVAKMVVMISTLFISCFVPQALVFIAMATEPEFSLTGKYSSILIVAGGFDLILESINSSANIFIYYQMSSKYRVVFVKLFKTSEGESGKSSFQNLNNPKTFR